MMLLAALIMLWPSRLIGAVGLAMRVTYDVFDGKHAAWLGSAQNAWKVLHNLAFFQLRAGYIRWNQVQRLVVVQIQTFGRVPLFFYLLHLPLLHGVAILLSISKYGKTSWLHQDLMTPKGLAIPIPSGYGYGLEMVYVVWLLVEVLLYPACLWFGEVKKKRRDVILRYL